ncbi:ABC transporter permease subunit [Arenibaculum pallidiluteum]|uniref:ABC transporter permease subunit n=1 Tax=Arenibaculum pallidiluteum TaxID=2812559 RepID=UPI001A9769AF|nr:ABC transporter permease subunit [Arenibaculum pallidiluteum]
MRNTLIVFRREFAAYFSTPLAAVFLVIFLALAAGLAFHLGRFFTRGEADLEPFFVFHPWLFLILIPALGMRLWAEERRSGTIELLMTLPVRTGEVVVGKFLAGWAFAAVALALTLPMWLTVNYLGDPDNGVIAASYIGSWLMAGALLALAAAVSALTKNQVIAFVVGAACGFLLLMSGLDLVLGAFRPWAPPAVVDFVASLSFLTHFGQITKGVLEARSLLYFGSLIALSLFANAIFVELKKAR